MNAKKKDVLSDKLDAAQEQEAGSERDRHQKEEAILATLIFLAFHLSAAFSHKFSMSSVGF